MLLPAAAAVDRAGPAAVQEVAEPFERLHSTGRGKARRLEYLTNLREQGIGNYTIQSYTIRYTIIYKSEYFPF